MCCSGFGGVRAPAGVDPECHAEGEHHVRAADEGKLLSESAEGLRSPPRPEDPAWRRRHGDRREGALTDWAERYDNVIFIL